MAFSDQRTALLDELNATSSDTFFTTAILNRFINRSVQWFATLKPWQQIERAKTQEIVLAGDATDDYWDYPSDFITDSVYRLELEGEKYKKILFRELLEERENNEAGTKKLFSDHRRQLHLKPRPTGGTLTLDIWGSEIPAALSADSDTHPWNGERTAEEAIHKYALSLCYRKKGGSYKAEAKKAEEEAYALAEQVWNGQRAAQADYKTESAEMFEHTDFLAERGELATERGSFETC